MIKRFIRTLRNLPLLSGWQDTCRSWVQSRPSWGLPASVKWLVYAGIFMYSRNGDSSDGIWKWEESLFGIPVPTLTSSAIQEGFIAACLLASFFFFIEPLLTVRWSKRIHAVQKQASWIMVDGFLSWVAYMLGVLPIISANIGWWGGELAFLLGMLLLLAMPVKTIVDVCKAPK